jgi:hypothetical protein
MAQGKLAAVGVARRVLGDRGGWAGDVERFQNELSTARAHAPLVFDAAWEGRQAEARRLWEESEASSGAV